jgi:hypothetical protein
MCVCALLLLLQAAMSDAPRDSADTTADTRENDMKDLFNRAAQQLVKHATAAASGTDEAPGTTQASLRLRCLKHTHRYIHVATAAALSVASS